MGISSSEIRVTRYGASCLQRCRLRTVFGKGVCFALINGLRRKSFVSTSSSCILEHAVGLHHAHGVYVSVELNILAKTESYIHLCNK